MRHGGGQRKKQNAKHTARTEGHKGNKETKRETRTERGNYYGTCRWGEDGQGPAQGWRKRGTASRKEAYQEKGTMREEDWAAGADRYRLKDSEKDKEIHAWCRTKEKGEEERRRNKDVGSEGDRDKK